jgi:hypothetical protein
LFGTATALLALLACNKLGTDLDQVVALEIILPDSGKITVGDTLFPLARALDGRGDTVTAAILWAALDTAIITVLDSTTGATYGKAPGTGRLQARIGGLRSNPIGILVRDSTTLSTFPYQSAPALGRLIER